MNYFFAYTFTTQRWLANNRYEDIKKYPAFVEVYEYMGYHIVITGNHYAVEDNELLHSPVRTAIMRNEIYPIFLSSKTEAEFIDKLCSTGLELWDYERDEFMQADYEYMKQEYVDSYGWHEWHNMSLYDKNQKLIIDIEIIDPDNLILHLEFDTTGRVITGNLLQSFIRTINVSNGVKDWAMVNKGVVVLKNKYSDCANAKPTNNKRGSNHFAWARMVKLRDKVCTQCGATEDLHAHHIKPYKEFPELKYDINNGVTLCAHCHRLHHKLNGR
jgi:hypothetical protein